MGSSGLTRQRKQHKNKRTEPMDDRKIQNAIHALHDNYDALARLLTGYEAWGGGPAEDADCGCLLGSPLEAAPLEAAQ